MRRLFLPLVLIAAGCGPAAAPSTAPPVAVKDPYPECALVRKYLDENVDDPNYEVTYWGKPEIMEKSSNATPFSAAIEKGDITVIVRYRAKNKVGAKVMRAGTYIIRGGKTLCSDDREWNP